MSRLADNIAVITGAQQGIGYAIARAFLAEGAHVIANWLDDADAIASLAEEDGGERLVTVHGDITTVDGVNALFEAADAAGGASTLVNNAAIFPRVPFLEMTDADWDGVMDINLKAGFRCAREFASRAVHARRAGSMLNMTSGAAFRSSPRGVHYVTSKAGVVGMTRALALELAEHSIRVNAIAPGLTDTAQPRYGMTEDELAEAAAAHPGGRMATPDDIASAAVFLSSKEATHVTGQTLHVNGGQYLG